MNVAKLIWWERDRLLTQRDKDAVIRAKGTPWAEISEDWAETEAGRYELQLIIKRKFHREEFNSGIL